MSKVDAQRAMREARFAERQAAARARPAPIERAAPEPPAVRPAATEPTKVTAAAAPGLCGHRSMGGKSCRRPAGHAEKNHRYV